MKRMRELLFLFLLGGCIYYSFEILFRGFSHWTMFVLGGVCLCFIWLQGVLLNWTDPLWTQIIRCIVFVTSLEFISGIVLNKWLHLNIWDYSELPYNLFGQICLQFMIIFSGFCFLGIIISGYLMYFMFQEEKPSYTVF